MLAGSDDGLGDSFQYDLIHVVDVSFPNRALFVSLKSVEDLLQLLVDHGTGVFDHLLSLSEIGAVQQLEVVGSHGSVLSLQDGLVDLGKGLVDLLDALFHLKDNLVGGVDDDFGLFDEDLDFVVEVPFKVIQPCF